MITEKKEVKGTFKYNGDSKCFHRYEIEAESGIVGSLYMPQDIDKLKQETTHSGVSFFSVEHR